MLSMAHNSFREFFLQIWLHAELRDEILKISAATIQGADIV